MTNSERRAGVLAGQVQASQPKGSVFPGWTMAGLRDGRNPLPRVRPY